MKKIIWGLIQNLPEFSSFNKTATTRARKNSSSIKTEDMFHVHAFNPHPLLRQCIDSYQIASVDLPDGGYLEHRFMPHVSLSLVIGLAPGNNIYDCIHAEFRPTHFIVGPTDQACRVRLFPGMHNMVISFKPCGFYKIFHTPASYYYKRSLNAFELFGKEIHEIAWLLGETHLSGKIELMDSWLLKKMQVQKKTHRNIDEAIRLIEKNQGNISMGELQMATFTTKRTLERHFLEQVGLNPKTYSRIIRFKSVIDFIESNLDIKWRQLADRFGYYDQSHFIHEFKTLCGSLPQDYFSLKPDFDKILQV
jgi:AraC-like DNA-binding protein